VIEHFAEKFPRGFFAADDGLEKSRAAAPADLASAGAVQWQWAQRS